jgi:hypothetical protein
MTAQSTSRASDRESSKIILIFAWLGVGLPLLWGVGQTIGKAAALFH